MPIIFEPSVHSSRGSRLAPFESIAFVTGGKHGEDLWMIHPDGTGLGQLMQGTGWDDLPAWSPDESQIAFLRERAIYVVNDDDCGLMPGDQRL